MGPEGPEGPPGDDGAANIETVILSYSSDDAEIDGGIASAGFRVAEITEEVYESGVVQCYYDLDGPWIALPWTIGTENYSIEFTYAYDEGTLVLLWQSSDGVILRSDIPDGRVKVVVIPPTESNSLESADAHKMENMQGPF